VVYDQQLILSACRVLLEVARHSEYRAFVSGPREMRLFMVLFKLPFPKVQSAAAEVGASSCARAPVPSHTSLLALTLACLVYHFPCRS